MKYKIDLPTTWRPGGRIKMLHPGVYRVPEDMAEAMAERAMKEAGAMRFEDASTLKPVSDGFRAKGPAPENKTKPADAAFRDKTALD